MYVIQKYSQLVYVNSMYDYVVVSVYNTLLVSSNFICYMLYAISYRL